jgi:hypothetical protein
MAATTESAGGFCAKRAEEPNNTHKVNHILLGTLTLFSSDRYTSC